jgi:hypothetical protein
MVVNHLNSKNGLEGDGVCPKQKMYLTGVLPTRPASVASPAGDDSTVIGRETKSGTTAHQA